MKAFGLTFHHLGLALSSATKARVFLTELGYSFGAEVYDPEQNVNLQMCNATEFPDIEIITPGEGDGPLTPILKRYDELLYHTCYEVDDLAQSLAAMEQAKLRVLPVAEPKPAILFGGRRVSFYKVMGFGLIELLEPAD